MSLSKSFAKLTLTVSLIFASCFAMETEAVTIENKMG